jgi:hypothetical protein
MKEVIPEKISENFGANKNRQRPVISLKAESNTFCSQQDQNIVFCCTS